MASNDVSLAYKLGAHAAAAVFTKQAAFDGPAGGMGGYGTEAAQPADPNGLLQQLPAGASLGDPNFWQGGSQQGQPQPQDAEDAIGLLPGGTFQGANIRITPEGEKTTNVKVSPDALMDPEALRAMFQADPTAKIEMQQPDAGPDVAVQGGPGTPGTGGATLAGQAPGQE